MLRLMLLRHAKSDWSGKVDDHDRPLTEGGRRASTLMGRSMAAQGLRPDLAVVSTARRAQETWKRAGPALAEHILQRDEPRLYGASAEAILEVIHETQHDVRTLLLVGHNPGLGQLAVELVGTAREPAMARLQEKFPTGALAVVDFDVERWGDVSAGLGHLAWFETPKSVAR